MSAVGACAAVGGRVESPAFVRSRCETDGNTRDCRILTLPPQRVFVESLVPALKGSQVTLKFRLPNGHQVCARGVVSEHRFQVGFNVNLVGLSTQDDDQINS